MMLEQAIESAVAPRLARLVETFAAAGWSPRDPRFHAWDLQIEATGRRFRREFAFLLHRTLPISRASLLPLFNPSADLFAGVDRALGTNFKPLLEVCGEVPMRPLPLAQVRSAHVSSFPLLALILRSQLQEAERLSAIRLIGVVAAWRRAYDNDPASCSHLQAGLIFSGTQVDWQSFYSGLDVSLGGPFPAMAARVEAHFLTRWPEHHSTKSSLFRAAVLHACRAALGAKQFEFDKALLRTSSTEDASRPAAWTIDPDDWSDSNPLSPPGKHQEADDLDHDACPSGQRISTQQDENAHATDGQERLRKARAWHASALQNQYLPLAFDTLPPQEAKALAESVEELTRSPHPDSRSIGAVCCLSLALGISLEDCASWCPTSRAGVYFLAQPCVVAKALQPMPNMARPGAQFSPRGPRDADVMLGLPGFLANVLAEAVIADQPNTTLAQFLGSTPDTLVGAARHWLVEYRARSNHRATVGRIASWKGTEIYARSANPVHVHWLLAGDDTPPLPAAYYQALRTRDLAVIHEDCLNTLWPGQIESTADVNLGWTGSFLNPEPAWFQSCVKQATATLAGQTSDRRKALCDRHNALQALYVLTLLLATGHRVVGDPFERLALGPWLTIDDKYMAEQRSHRVIPLPRVAVRVLVSQRDHLTRLAREIRSSAPELAARIDALLNGDNEACPGFFFVSESSALESITPATLRERLPLSLWPLPLNIGRHWLATGLAERGATADQVASYLGHGALGTQNVCAYSPRKLDSLFDADFRRRHDEFLAEPQFSLPGSFLPNRTAGDVLISPRPALRRFAFGARAREAHRQQEMLRTQRQVDELIQEHLQGRPPDQLNEPDAEALFEKLRQTGGNLRTAAMANRMTYLRQKICNLVGQERFSRWLVRGVPMILDGMQTSVDESAPQTLAGVRGLQQHLASEFELALALWEPQQDAMSLPSAAQCIALLIVQSGMIDVVAWRKWFAAKSQDRRLEVIRTASTGYWVSLPVSRKNTRAYPVSQALGEVIAAMPAMRWQKLSESRLHTYLDRTRQLVGLDQKLGTLEGLCGRVRAALSMMVSGLTLGYLDGTSGMVSPMPSCWYRIHAGGVPLALGQHETADEQQEPGPAASWNAAGGSSTKKEDVERFIRLVQRAFPRVGRADAQGTVDAQPNGSRVRQLAINLRTVEEFAKKHALPETCMDLLSWLRSLCEYRHRGKLLALSTIETRWSAVGRRLVEAAADMRLAEESGPVIEDLYEDILDSAETEQMNHIYFGFRSFHKHLQEGRGAASLDWAYLAEVAEVAQSNVDAHVVTEPEYLRALRQLLADKESSPRERALHSALLVLGYRFGLRYGEAIGLRLRDVQISDKGCTVTVTGNVYRSLKTERSARSVPAILPLHDDELGCLRRWLAHVEEFGSGSYKQVLFSRDGKHRQLTPRNAAARRIGQALRLATGDPSVRFHHLRHSLASRLLATVLGLASTREGKAICAAGSPQALLNELLRTSFADRRAIWAVAGVLGHASPMSTLRSYFHFGHALAQRELTDAKWLPERKVAQPVLPMLNQQQLATVGRLELPPLPSRLTALTPLLIDRILDLARRGRRMEVIAELAMADEDLVVTVLQRANLDAEKLVGRDASGDWRWTEPADIGYGSKELGFIQARLERANAVRPDFWGQLRDLWLSRYAANGRMLMLQDEKELQAALSTLGQVFNKQELQLCLPSRVGQSATKEPGSITQLSRQGTPLTSMLTSEQVTAWKDAASSHGIETILVGRLPRSRSGGHEHELPNRAGLRVKEYGGTAGSNAKVGGRLIGSLAVLAGVYKTTEVAH